jgi:hypothetical protein
MMVTVQTEYLGSGRQPKKRKRYLILPQPDLIALEQLPQARQQLLRQCLKVGTSSRWLTWQKLAGLAYKNDLDALYDWLLRYGCIVAYESFEKGEWWPYKVDWQHADILRRALGLPIVEEQQSILQQLLLSLEQQATENDSLHSLITALASLPVNTALKRGHLLQSLLNWQAEQRSGSYRDFALFARGDTKALSASEWAWLEGNLELIEYGIQPHTPLLYLSANMQLQLAEGVLDIASSQPFIALPVTSLATLAAIQSTTFIRSWIAVENLTCFERLAAQREQDTAVVWLPGFAPSWWQQCMSQLLSLCPAPLQVACDPDPSGVYIALHAMQLWHSHQLSAQPWRMGVAELQNCQHRKPLDTHDQRRLQGLLGSCSDLDPLLAELVQYMHKTQQKGEQESYL